MVLERILLSTALILISSCSGINYKIPPKRDISSISVSAFADGCVEIIQSYFDRTKKIRFEDLKFPDDRLKKKYSNLFKKIEDQDIGQNKKLRSVLLQQIKDHSDPYSVYYSLRETDEISTDEQVLYKMFELHKILVRIDTNGLKNLKELNKWIDSDIQALVVYDTLARIGLQKNRRILDYLFEKNPHFLYSKRNRGPPGSIVTFSFEKESSHPDIIMLFKNPKLSDEEWLELPEEDRLRFLKESTEFQQLIKNKDFLSADKVSPTALKPYFMSGYSRELESYFGPKGYSWEIANKMYEINVERIMNQLREVKRITNETHSIHAHVVFEMPYDYSMYKHFNLWLKMTNDYLYLKGLEEGLHASELVNIAKLPNGKISIKNLLSGFYQKELPAELSDVNRRNGKFFSMAVRGDIYGPGSTSYLKKVGLELRDTTRNLDILEDHMNSISESVSSYRWENLGSLIEHNDTITLDPSIESSLKVASEYFDEKTIKYFYDIDPTFAIPLVKYENAEYINFVEGSKLRVSPEDVDAIVESREIYVKSLKDLLVEIDGFIRNGEIVEDEIKKIAIRMSIAEWAKKARISQYYQNI